MWQYDYSQPSDELMHYGKKGMKWGRRKSVGPNGAKVTTTKIPFNTYKKTINKDGSRQYEQTSRSLIGSTQTTTRNFSKNQAIAAKAITATVLASYGAVLVKTLM